MCLAVGGQYKAAPECNHDMGYVWEVSIRLLPNEVIIVIFWGGQYNIRLLLFNIVISHFLRIQYCTRFPCILFLCGQYMSHHNVSSISLVDDIILF